MSLTFMSKLIGYSGNEENYNLPPLQSSQTSKGWDFNAESCQNIDKSGNILF